MTAHKQSVTCSINDLPAQFYCTKDQATYYLEPTSNIIFQPTAPAVSQMNEYADDEYSEGVYKEYAAARELKIATALPRLAVIKKLAKGNRLLDVGCATGFFLEAAVKQGFDAQGVEFSTVAIAQARADIRARITRGDVNVLLQQQATEFDVVSAFDIVEHVQDPKRFLSQIFDILVPGGVLALSTPDTGHFLRYVMGSRWPMLQPMQHTYLFSKPGMADLLKRCGFVNVQVKTTHKVLTIDYLGDQMAATNPQIYRLYRSLRWLLPKPLRNRPFGVNIGELIAFAQKPHAQKTA